MLRLGTSSRPRSLERLLASLAKRRRRETDGAAANLIQWIDRKHLGRGQAATATRQGGIDGRGSNNAAGQGQSSAAGGPAGNTPSGDGSETLWACGAAPGETADPGTGNWVVEGKTLLSAADAAFLDLYVQGFMSANDIPNGALAVVAPDGRLVHSRGYTNRRAYSLAAEPVFIATPNSRFRIASVSKVITAVAVLQADEAGLLPSGINGFVRDLVDLSTYPPPVVWVPEPRLNDLRIIHLLTHTGGWMEAALQQDPSGAAFLDGVYPGIAWPLSTPVYSLGSFVTDMPEQISALFDSTRPVTFDQTLRFGNCIQMAWDPGSHYSYFNYGYWLLGRVVEGSACRSYESWVRERIWRPLGAWDSLMGATDRRERCIDEVPYYDQYWPSSGASTVASVRQSSPWEAGPFDYNPYAGFDVRLFDAHGGWVSSAYDLALLMRDLFVGPSVLLSDFWRRWMFTPQIRTSPTNATHWMSFGWNIRSSRILKGGQLNGSIARITWLNASTGASYVYLFNRNWGALSNNGTEGAMDTALQGRLSTITSWGPTTDDLFVP